jgi:hypothetical protein
MATNLNSRLSTGILEENSGAEYSNSEVTSNIMAITANHKLKSDNDNGKDISALNLT